MHCHKQPMQDSNQYQHTNYNNNKTLKNKKIKKEQKTDIIALVETLLCENDAIELNNYETIRNDR